MKHHGCCHCKSVTFIVEAPEVLEVTNCNCSMCSMTGFVHLIVQGDDFTLLSGEENLTSYRFNTKVANHLFCKTCGVKSFYTPRSHPDGTSVNVNCLDLSTVKAINATDFDGQNWEDNIAGLKGEDGS